MPSRLLIAAFSLALASPALVPQAKDSLSWWEAARKAGLTESEIDRLEQDRLLITNRTYRQVFTPYIESGIPVFITSDSLLNGFHVLFEESIARLEGVNVRKLRRLLRDCWRALPRVDEELSGDHGLIARSKRRATILLAVALALLGETPDGLSEEIRPHVRSEAARVETAEERTKPAWLGPPDPAFMAIDYSRCKPRGFYTRSEALERYFRAVAWLQAIPLRVNRDEELVCALLLGDTINRVGLDLRHGNLWKRFQALEEIIGLGDDWDAYEAGSFAYPTRNDRLSVRVDANWLTEVRIRIVRAARREGHAPLINDQVRLPPSRDTALIDCIGFRFLTAHRTPGAILFGRSTDLRDTALRGRTFPTGLEMAALLGSEQAMARLQATPRVQAIIRESRALLSGDSLHVAYLKCLQSLLDDPETDAPSFFGGPAWRAKSINAVLAGWAQMRHTLVLQAKQTASFLGLASPPPGLVEPEPEFFGRLARLVKQARSILAHSGALGSDLGGVTADLRRIATALEELDIGTHHGMSWRAAMRRLSEDMVFRRYRKVLHRLWRPELGSAKNDADRARLALARLGDFIQDLEEGRPLDDPEIATGLTRVQSEFRGLWDALEETCRRLETLAHKQLRGVAFSRIDKTFIKDFGKTLAWLMFYEGNSYLAPSDDAPRVVDVFSEPRSGKVLTIGVARPRALWVLYPWQGRVVLCRGAVLPYHEFTSDTRHTDAEWKVLLDSDRRPPPPAWLAPALSPHGLGRASFRRR